MGFILIYYLYELKHTRSLFPQHLLASECFRKVTHLCNDHLCYIVHERGLMKLIEVVEP